MRGREEGCDVCEGRGRHVMCEGRGACDVCEGQGRYVREGEGEVCECVKEGEACDACEGDVGM